MSERGSKTSAVPVVWATFGILLGRSKYFPVAIGTINDKQPDTMQQSMEWRQSVSARPNRFRVLKCARKVVASIFRNKDGIFLIAHLQKNQTVSTEHYVCLPMQLKDILKEKCGWKLIKLVLFLYGNAPSHRALASKNKLAYLGFQCLDKPPYSSDVTPSDFHLFPGLDIRLKIRHFFPKLRSLLARRPG